MSFQIAIDGPAGAGKSTIARRVAADFGALYVDTGALYRAMALYFLRNKMDLADQQVITEACENIQVSLEYQQGQQQVLLNGENVTGLIRSQEVGDAASATSSYPVVRDKLRSLQQQLAEQQDVVMDGRDIGTCVLPKAPLKIFLTASAETRAKRRYLELQEKGVPCDLQEIQQEIQQRDHRDMTREIAPLCQAPDAILVDSSELTIQEVTDEILKYARERRQIREGS